MIMVRLLRWRHYRGLSGWAQCNRKGPYKREAVESDIERRDNGNKGWHEEV